MPLARIDDHAESGVSLLLQEYKDRPRIDALIRSVLNRVQEVEDATWDVLMSRVVDTATGAQLDIIGRIVRQPRISTDDETYRARIKTKIRANRSGARPDDIIEVALLASGIPPEKLTYTELAPLTFIVETFAPVIDYEVAKTTAELIRFSKPPGVRGSYHYSTLEESETFAFSTTDEEEDDPARGFGGDDPDSGPGGRFIGDF